MWWIVELFVVVVKFFVVVCVDGKLLISRVSSFGLVFYEYFFYKFVNVFIGVCNVCLIMDIVLVCIFLLLFMMFLLCSDVDFVVLLWCVWYIFYIKVFSFLLLFGDVDEDCVLLLMWWCFVCLDVVVVVCGMYVIMCEMKCEVWLVELKSIIWYYVWSRFKVSLCESLFFFYFVFLLFLLMLMCRGLWGWMLFLGFFVLFLFKFNS